MTEPQSQQHRTREGGAPASATSGAAPAPSNRGREASTVVDIADTVDGMVADAGRWLARTAATA